MPGQLQDVRELEARVDAAGYRGVVKQDILDILKSHAYVGGVLSLKNGVSPDNDLVIAAGWNRCDALFDRSVDTLGVKDGVTDVTDPGAYFEIRKAGAGDWEMTGLLMDLDVDQAGDYTVRLARVDTSGVSAATPYLCAITADAPGRMHFAIACGIEKAVEQGERLQPEIRGPNGATVTGIQCQFGVRRG